MYPGTFSQSTPDKPAVIMANTGESVSYGALDERSMRLAQLLYSKGLRRGDRVAVFAENHPRYYEVYWAAVRSGLYVVGVNRHLGADEASYIVENSGADALITTAALADTATAILPNLKSCEVRLVMDGAARGFDRYEESIAAFPGEPLEEQWRGDVLLYSSGTTGRPKGVRRELLDERVDDPPGGKVAMLAKSYAGMGADTVYLNPAPMYHAAPLQWSTAVHELGGTVVLMERFDAEGLLELVERYQVTHTQVVPTMFVRMLRLPGDARGRYDLSSLQRVMHAAAPCPLDVKREMLEWLGPIVDEYYSSTEGNCFSYITAADWLDHPGSVGKPVLGEPHVCDESGDELPPGQAGLLYFLRRDSQFEYLGDDAKTQQSRHPKEPMWTTLGDIGYVDEAGYLYLTDRAAFTIISGGVNIYPAEIEECLGSHPAVADAAVFGLPDREMGQFVQAVVALESGHVASPDLAQELREHVRAHLAGFKVPRSVDFRSELPRLPTGKLVKGKLVDEYLQRASDLQPIQPAAG